MKLIAVLICILNIAICKGQTWESRINDSDYNNRLSKGLMSGDMLPDIPLGEVINNNTGKQRFSEFNGKIIILDFWSTWCQSCIADFPKMEELQNKFKDEIQIFLVNPTQTWAQVSPILNKRMPNLPIIVKDSFGISTQLLNLFPSRSTGHQVWIGKNGSIILRGAHYNNTPNKIQEAILGKNIFAIQDNGTTPQFDPNLPYINLIGEFKTTSVAYSSTITQFNNEYNPEGFGFVEDLYDTLTNTFRRTYVNFNILNLYSIAFQDYLKKMSSKLLYGPFRNSHLGAFGYHFFDIPEDTGNYTSEFIRKKSDIDVIRPKICYEQIVPASVSKEQQLLFMIEDLNRYLKGKIGREVVFNYKEKLYYSLVRTSKLDKLKAKSDLSTVIDTIEVNKDKVIRYKNAILDGVGDLVRESKLSDFLASNYWKGKPCYIFNETGFEKNKRIDIQIPFERLNTIEDLRKVLKSYDLDLVERKGKIGFLTFIKR